MKLRIFLFLLFAQPTILLAQEQLNISSIPDSLTENANAVVRLNQRDITISSANSMNVVTTRIITVLNKNGTDYIDAGEYYDESTNVKSVEAEVFNSRGEKITKFRKKDFKDVSVSGGSGITDNKYLYLDYTPVQYPFTVVYTSEVQTKNTAFIPRWYPLEGSYCATQKAVINITYQQELGFRYKEYNFNGINLTKSENLGTLHLELNNLPAVKREDISPSFSRTVPYVLFSLNKFHLEGVDGQASDWVSFGKWYSTLLEGTDELPAETVAKIKALVGTETDPLKKAAIVYKYMQSKTRYVSIQLGIGGWKPMKAADVDRLGYGDCKALSNYTRALLKAVGVPAYNAVIYGDYDKRDLKEDFVSMQGNHMILAIPNNDNYVWLECTSQTMPFGFQGGFTDDRVALIVKPEGGEIVRTHVYKAKSNTQLSSGTYTITEDGSINGNVKIVSGGLQYGRKYVRESESPTELDKIYKNYFSNINNLKLLKKELTNNSETQQLTEDLAIEAESYCNKSGNRLMFAVNAFNQFTGVPQRYRERKMPFEIPTGFYDEDEIIINLPEGFTLEAKPEDVVITDKFGEYKAEYQLISDKQLRYKRTLLMNEGEYSSTEYNSYREFREQISRNDNAKVVLLKN